MRKIFILIFYMFNFSLQSQNINKLEIKILTNEFNIQKDNFEKNLLKQDILKDLILEYLLVNNSDSIYAVLIDKSKFLVYETTDVKKYFKAKEFPLKNQIFSPAIIIKNMNSEITETGFSIQGDYFNSLPNYKSIDNYLIILKPHSDIKVTTHISLPILNNILNNGVFSSQYFIEISLDGMEKGIFSMILNQDEEIIKGLLSKKLKRKFKRQNIYIYNGEIKSNDIPIFVK